MKAYISVDMEGMPFIVSGEHTFLKGALFSEARRIATRITLFAAEAFHRNGFEEVFIADSHGPMINIEVENLPEYITFIRGFPRPLSMVVGVDKTDVAVFLGYHAKAGTLKSNFDHTHSSATIDYVKINGIPASEFLFNTYVAGHYNVPVVMVAGDKALIEEDVSRFTPWAEKVVFKQSLSRFASINPSLSRIEKELEKAVENAVYRFRRGEMKALKLNTPLEFEVRFLGTEMADTAELLPIVERIDGKTIKYHANDIVEAYKIFELLIAAAPKLYPYSAISI
ncbi:MAG: peptide transporter [Desulfurococcales archaeon]|jgi:D-amino peptidase|nr:peptide transporter [Desulfurococcales archaeon]